MPSTPYDLVKDDQDIRIPLHDDKAFMRGITFQAKFIGWEEVPRPNTRAEIVQAMRAIRHECKMQNMRKIKVTINISVNGVRVSKKKKRKKKQRTNEPDDILLMEHPIYRIFYVSHDSSDLKIFSYIARDGKTDTFTCSVFKSNKKSQAMLIVRTVGQAFEVCHKTNPNDQSSDIVDHDRVSDQCSDDDIVKKDPSPIPQDMAPLQRPNHLEIMPQTNSNLRRSPGSDSDRSPTSPISSAKEIQQLKELLEQQTLVTRQTVAQLTLVKEQLISETKARMEAQVRTKQLLQQNRELLEYLVSLGGYVEPSQAGLTSANIALAPQSPLQMYLQDQPEMPSPIRKAFLSSSNNNNLTSISQHLNNLGSVNQQLSTLTQQLTGLNQQSQNLQNLQNFQGLNNLPLQTSNVFPALNQIQNMSNNVTNLSHANQDVISQNYQINQDLLNKLQNLNLGIGNNSNANNNGQSINNNNSPNNSFIYANPGHLSSSPNNNSFNYLNSPNSMGNLTPSPMGTLNRNSFLMDDNLGLSIDKNLNNIDESSHFIKPISQVGTLTTIDTDGKVKVIVPVSNGDGRDESSSSSSLNRRGGGSERKINVPNMVMLKVTDEQGNVTNQRKLAATPSFITRSTSEKVPNRSQIMSEVQRAGWARHTTK